MAMTHERREQLAREQGFSSYREKRHATPEQRIAAAQRTIATNPTYARAAAHQIGRQAVGGRKQIIPTPAGTLIASQRNDVLLAQIRKAAGRDEVIRARFSYTTDDGEPKGVALWGKSGYSADQLHHVITSQHRTDRYPNGWVAGALARFASSVYGGDVVDPETITNIQLTASDL